MFANSSFDQISLDSRNVVIGKLEQANEQAAQGQIILERTSATPKRVNLWLSFHQFDLICQWWSPNSWEGCLRYEWVWIKNWEGIKLSFKKAKKLNDSEVERIHLDINQVSAYSRKLDIKARIDEDYDIIFKGRYDARWFWTKPKLIFISR